MQRIVKAIRQNNVSLVRFLVNLSKFDVNTPDPDRDNKTLLHEAAALGHLEIVRLLVERGANVNNESLGGEAAIHDAAENDQVEVVRYLAEHGSVHLDDVEDMLPYDNLTSPCTSGVTRMKGQPGQLTNKQLSRRSAELSWVGEGAAYRNPP